MIEAGRDELHVTVVDVVADVDLQWLLRRAMTLARERDRLCDIVGRKYFSKHFRRELVTTVGAAATETADGFEEPALAFDPK